MMRTILDLLRPIAERFPRLLMAYRLAKARWPLFDEPVATPLGFRLIGNASMERGEFEAREAELIRALLEDADMFINVGANIGYYCCMAASLGRPVLAFEPVAVNLQYLLKNVEANGWDHLVTVVPMALGDRRGVARIYGEGTGASLVRGWAKGPEDYPTLVVTSTLDAEAGSLAAGKKCLIVADIEGAERGMLDGARGLLGSSPKPVWIVEISVGEHQPKGISMNPDLLRTFEIFWAQGYEAWTTTRPYRPVTPEEVRQVVATGTDTLRTHNFLFVEGGRAGCWSRQTPPGTTPSAFASR